MQRHRLAKGALAASALVLLGACTTVPTAPSILALPGSNRSFESFRADDQDCRNYAMRQITVPAADPGVQSAVVGTAVGAAAGAAFGGQQGAAIGAGTGLLMGSAVGADSSRAYTYGTQRQYDHAYIQCMYGRGHKVPVSAEFARNLSQSPVGPAQSGNYPPPPPPSTVPPPDYVPPR
ncbi:MAG: glycine zipper family protein [Propionivibrio sp.]